MPRLFVSTPKYRLHRASGQAVITIQGKDHYLGPWRSKASKIEYDRLVGEWLAAGRPTTTKRAACQITIVEIAAVFWKYATERYKKKGRHTGTHEKYRNVLSLLRKRYGHTLAIDFGPLAIKALRLVLIENGNSRNYINEFVHRIRKVFKWAASEQLVPAAIYQELASVDALRKDETAARETAPVPPVADEIIEATLPHLPSVVSDMVRLQRLTGARPGEICAMKPSHIDRTGDVWVYVPAEHKTEHHGCDRTIFIGPQGQSLLQQYLLGDADAYCFSPVDSEKKRRLSQHEKRKTPLNHGNRPGISLEEERLRPPGKEYTNDSYRRAIQGACELAFDMPMKLRKINPKLPFEQKAVLRKEAAAWRKKYVWSPQQLRHTAATQIRKQYGLEAAQCTLGHSRMDTTEIYAEKNLELASRVAKEVG